MSEGSATVAVTVIVVVGGGVVAVDVAVIAAAVVAAASAVAEHREGSAVLDHSGRVRALVVILAIDPLGVRDLKVLRLLLLLLLLSKLGVEMRLSLDRVGL